MIDTEAVRARLLKERDDVTADLERLRADTGRSVEDATDEDGNDSHLGDAATETYDREMEMTLEETLEHRLEEVEGALARVDAGSYGVCEVCGKPIDPARLEALPYATKCIEDKRREERT
jgi:RNA polymerase-binding protein DksA